MICNKENYPPKQGNLPLKVSLPQVKDRRSSKINLITYSFSNNNYPFFFRELAFS